MTINQNMVWKRDDGEEPGMNPAKFRNGNAVERSLFWDSASRFAPSGVI